MIDSRDLKDLHPAVRAKAERMLAACKTAGIDLIVTSTLRDIEQQNALYARGRTKPGPKVTNARGGQSFHNYGLAFDVVPKVAGKPVWSTSGAALTIWQKVGKIGKSCGLEWAGDWRTFREYPHFQDTGGLTLAQLQAGQRPALTA